MTLDAGGQQSAVKRYYAIGGQPIALRDAGGTFYLLTDHLGSVVSVLDGGGAVVGEQLYRPFGQSRLTPGITQTDRGFRAAPRSEAEGHRAAKPGGRRAAGLQCEVDGYFAGDVLVAG